MAALDEIRTFLSAHADEGLSLAAFARTRGVAPKRAYAWRDRLRRSDAADAAVAPAVFRELRPVDRGDDCDRTEAGAITAAEPASGLVIEMPAHALRMTVVQSGDVGLAVDLILRIVRSGAGC